MAEKFWMGMKPAIEAAVKAYEEGLAEPGSSDDGDLLNSRIQAALRGSDWRYVKTLGGTLEREI